MKKKSLESKKIIKITNMNHIPVLHKTIQRGEHSPWITEFLSKMPSPHVWSILFIPIEILWRFTPFSFQAFKVLYPIQSRTTLLSSFFISLWCSSLSFISLQCSSLSVNDLSLSSIYCHYCCFSPKSFSTFWNPMDCSPSGFSVHEISQARILEWVAFPSPGDVPDPGIKPTSPALAGGFFTIEWPGKPSLQ